MSSQKWREVSKAEFYSFIGGPANIHPRAERMESQWIDHRTNRIVGRSTPGYLCVGAETYYLARIEGVQDE